MALKVETFVNLQEFPTLRHGSNRSQLTFQRDCCVSSERIQHQTLGLERLAGSQIILFKKVRNLIFFVHSNFHSLVIEVAFLILNQKLFIAGWDLQVVSLWKSPVRSHCKASYVVSDSTGWEERLQKNKSYDSDIAGWQSFLGQIITRGFMLSNAALSGEVEKSVTQQELLSPVESRRIWTNLKSTSTCVRHMGYALIIHVLSFVNMSSSLPSTSNTTFYIYWVYCIHSSCIVQQVFNASTYTYTWQAWCRWQGWRWRIARCTRIWS